MRIKNAKQVTGHGNRDLRKDMVDIMNEALDAANPYRNAVRLVRRDAGNLIFDCPAFEAKNDPRSGSEILRLADYRNIYLIGAGKGVQWAALAIEEALGDALTDGVLIAKHGDSPLMKKTRVIYGAHPVPDENCVRGCEEIVALAEHVTEEDLVITLVGNGVSSLLTLPIAGVSLQDVQTVTRMMQIDRGVATTELNAVRNHLDALKGGKLTKRFSRAKKMIHILIADANHHAVQEPRHDYEGLLSKNVWLHNLPDASSFADAVHVLKKYDAWEECPPSVIAVLSAASPEEETLKPAAFREMDFRIFGIMPDEEHFIKTATRACEARGYHTCVLSRFVDVAADSAAQYAASVARSVESFGTPVPLPAALLSSGEMLVKTEGQNGVGGRNQEFVLAAAMHIAGHHDIVIGSCDTDGTDGPGGFSYAGAPSCLGGGIVDGFTTAEAEAQGIDINTFLQEHASSEPLWRLDCGLEIEQNTSLNDLTVLLIGAPSA